MSDDDSTEIDLTSVEVRDHLVDALRLSLIGPSPGHELSDERLKGQDRPSNWYLGGFLVPSDAPIEQRSDDDPDEDFEDVPDHVVNGEEEEGERKSARKSYFPASFGLSLLVPATSEELEVRVSWGDYHREAIDEDGESHTVWQRYPRDKTLKVSLTEVDGTPQAKPVPGSEGLELNTLVRGIPHGEIDLGIAAGTRSVSVFLVNRRLPDQEQPDTAYVFQPEIRVIASEPLVPQSSLGRVDENDWDECLADLHYADSPAYATGHGVATDWHLMEQDCFEVKTVWVPSADVERTEAVKPEGVTFDMDDLGKLEGEDQVRAALSPLIEQYRKWIESRPDELPAGLDDRKLETAEELLRTADRAAARIERGVDLLATDPEALEAFRVANRAIARALRKRLEIESPGWRPFQLGFILLNLPGLSDGDDQDREIVDLLFFPTGGGKTEAYLGLAAFVMVLRRLRNPEESARSGAGVSVIMRYTLRLLTLDQLSRAAGLVCALELERQSDEDRYGEWPFEIGLWVGKAASPNEMGRKGASDGTARQKVFQHKDKPSSRPAPVPIEACPWCNTALNPDSFSLFPNADGPSELRIVCPNLECDFSDGAGLPIVAVDESLYRRLPAFLIATADKFANLPWVGESGMILGGATRFDELGFYGPASPGKGKVLPEALAPPDLIIQDELHLISGPLGTMAGLYEGAIEALCVERNNAGIRPKIIASTATVRRAQDQVQALFARASTEIFPPAGPDRRDSFFAKVLKASESPGRRYIGIAAQGRNAKVVMRRVWLTLMGTAQRLYNESGGDDNPENPVDPYMTVLGYFTSLRELGGARRLLEEEVKNTVRSYGARRRFGEKKGLFRDRKRFSDVVELTSRVSTDKVADARRRLGVEFPSGDGRVDCAIATNMISVGLDISRLGLMVALGQPKTAAEYIQATSRVGRETNKPGLVITVFNMHKPRDRSHYERFRQFHETFYRSVEVSSVTPFSARALDRGLAGTVTTLARHSETSMTPYRGAEQIGSHRIDLEERLIDVFSERIREQPMDEEERQDRLDSVRSRIVDLLDSWATIAEDYEKAGVRLQYQQHEHKGPKPLLQPMIGGDFDPDLEPHQRKFRANRSLRDVEPEVNLYLNDSNP